MGRGAINSSAEVAMHCRHSPLCLEKDKFKVTDLIQFSVVTGVAHQNLTATQEDSLCCQAGGVQTTLNDA